MRNDAIPNCASRRASIVKTRPSPVWRPNPVLSMTTTRSSSCGWWGVHKMPQIFSIAQKLTALSTKFTSSDINTADWLFDIDWSLHMQVGSSSGEITWQHQLAILLKASSGTMLAIESSRYSAYPAKLSITTWQSWDCKFSTSARTAGSCCGHSTRICLDCDLKIRRSTLDRSWTVASDNRSPRTSRYLSSLLLTL